MNDYKAKYEQQIWEILVDFHSGDITNGEATASLLQLLTEARMQVWRDILGAGADNPEDLPDDFISVPGFWIKKQLAELKGEK